MEGFALFLGISIVISAVAHCSIETYLAAAFVAAPCSSIIFIGTIIVIDGNDSLMGLALVVSTAYAFGVALITGIPFWILRNTPPKKSVVK